MKRFNWLNAFKKTKKSIVREESITSDVIDNAVLIEITKLLTDQDAAAIEAITLLVNDFDRFITLYPTWEDECSLHIITAYWLTGYDSPCDFGAYIDWKQETNDIIWSLKPGIQNKGYQIDLNEIHFSGEEFTDEALYKINEYLETKGFSLAYWDTDSDCYHLFIVPTAKWDKLVALGQRINIEFSKDFLTS